MCLASLPSDEYIKFQVMIVGDLNIAASARDVHPSMDWGKMYHPEEIAAFRALLSGLTDVWRLQNPDATDCFTVWDEKTSARSVNRVRQAVPP